MTLPPAPVIASALLIAVLGGAARGQTDGPKESSPKWDMVEAIKNVDLSTEWTKREFGFAIANFSVNNKNGYDVRDLAITCDFFDQSGTRIHSKSADIFDIVRAKSEHTAQRINIGLVSSQARRGTCAITRLAKSASGPSKGALPKPSKTKQVADPKS
jgi:hypothetical protein